MDMSITEQTTKATKKRASGRQKILDVSIRLFAEHGYSGVSVRQIADQAGITLPAIYHHFGSKEALYRSVETALYSQHAEALLDVLHSTETPRKKLQNFVRGLIETLVVTPNYLKIMQRDLIEGLPENHDFLVRTSMQRVFDELSGLLEECAPGSGSGVQPIFLFSTILGFLTMRPVTSRLERYEFSTRPESTQIDLLVDAIVKVIDTNGR